MNETLTVRELIRDLTTFLTASKTPEVINNLLSAPVVFMLDDFKIPCANVEWDLGKGVLILHEKE